MTKSCGAPGAKIQRATEGVFKTVEVTGEKVSLSLSGRHEPEGPEAIAYLPEGFRRVTEDI